MKRNRERHGSTVIRFVLSVLLFFIITDPVVPDSISAESALAVPKALVAIHVSELTAALETIPAVPPTPAGAGNTGYQWWYDAWKYPVAYESVKEALHSDGTQFVEVSDSDIASGQLRNPDGTPRYPILISLAAEAIADNEIAPLREYVNAGGYIFIGSSSFTRNPDGTTRGNFALAAEMGLHMATPTLLNRYENALFSKKTNHWLVSHYPDGAINWHAPLKADEIPMGVTPLHERNSKHYAWKVVADDAEVLAQGDDGPLLTQKSYGKGKIIYTGAFQPLLGHGGFDASMYPYVTLRKTINLAFESFSLPSVRVSPWRYPYDAALIVRHDFENRIDLIKTIEASADFEQANGVIGEYYISTGALRTYEGSDKADIINGMRDAVSHGAAVGSHNGGLPNPVNPNLLPTDYDYWHWGPDEALDQSPPGYVDGRAYASASVEASFLDIDEWLTGLDNGRPGCSAAGDCPRIWASPAFNSTRDASVDLLEKLSVRTAGEQKVGPFPHWTLSYQNPGKRFSHLSIPVSSWVSSGNVLQALDDHTLATVRAAVDLYYDIGAIINIYGHESSTNGAEQREYVTYSKSKPRIWATNSIGIHDWWLTRSKLSVAPDIKVTDSSYALTATVSGVTDAESAVEVTIPNKFIGTVNVFLDGMPADDGSYRTTWYGVKVRVAPGVKKVRVQNSANAPPVSVNDAYSVYANLSLNVDGPGVLANDSDAEEAVLKAQLVNGPAHGTVTFNTNGSFSYKPDGSYTGTDSFSYWATDGTVTGNVASVSITVMPALVLDSVSLDPATVQGGTTTQCTLKLSGPAPSGGVEAMLSNGTYNVSVAVAGGSDTAILPINTQPVATSASVTIYATYGGVVKSTTLTINPPALGSLSITPERVTGGSSSLGTITLSGPAPSGGLAVTMASGSVNSSITVPAGSDSVSFPITTQPVASGTSYDISASLNGVTKTARLLVDPPVLSQFVMTPDSVTGGATSQGQVVLSGPAPADGVTVTLSDGSISSGLLVKAGSSSATFPFTTGPVTKVTTYTLTATFADVTKTATLTVYPQVIAPALGSLSVNPATLTGGATSQGTVTLTAPAPAGGLVVTLGSSAPAATPPASVTVEAGSSSAIFTIATAAVTASATATISATYGGVTKTTVLTVNPPAPLPAVSSVSLSPASVTGGTSSQGTVNLTAAAPAGGLVVTLGSSAPAATPPASVTVAAGSSSATFTISTATVTTATTATISATHDGVTKTAALTINPPAPLPAVSSVSLSPVSVTGGTSSQGTVTLTAAAPAGGLVVTLGSSAPAATPPASVTVAAGSSSATFTIATSTVTATTTATISATHGGVTKTAVLTVTASAPVTALSSFTMTPASVTGGVSTQGEVILSGPAPIGGAAVILSNGTASATVVIPAGSSSIRFTIDTAPVTSVMLYTITATYKGVTKSATLTVNPPVPPPAVSSFTLTPASVKGGGTTQGVVTLVSPAPAGGAVVTLSNGTASATVTVPAGSSSISFTINTPVVTTSVTYTITATCGGVTKSATLTVTPN